MKTRQYTITSGRYDDYKIVAQVEGAARPALSTLYKEFDQAFGYVRPRMLLNKVEDWEPWRAANRDNAQAERAAKASGLVGYDKAELFLDWLRKEKGYVTANITEFHV